MAGLNKVPEFKVKKANSGRKVTKKYGRRHMISVINNYTDDTDIPILKELCVRENWDYNYVIQLRKNKGIFLAIERLRNKKESAIEKGALKKELDSSMAIKSLNRLGWEESINLNVRNDEKNQEDYLDNLTLDQVQKLMNEIDKKEKQDINKRVKEKRQKELEKYKVIKNNKE